jgi:hypothetical protein
MSVASFEFLLLLLLCGALPAQVVDEHSTHSKLSDLDRIFLATNFEEDKKDVKGQVRG